MYESPKGLSDSQRLIVQQNRFFGEQTVVDTELAPKRDRIEASGARAVFDLVAPIGVDLAGEINAPGHVPRPPKWLGSDLTRRGRSAKQA